MTSRTLLQRVATLPPPFDPERAARGIADLQAAAKGEGNGAVADALAAWRADAAGEALLAVLFGNSPFLGRLLVREAALLPSLAAEAPEALAGNLLEGLRRDLGATTDLAEAMRLLREARRRMALLIACADIAGVWPLETVTGQLTALADTALQGSVDLLLREAAARDDVALADADAPSRDSGLVLLAMGKYGSRELNYSSDIDFMVFYDGEKEFYKGRRSPQEFFVRLTQSLVRLLQEPTLDGYVFRTDLRLRPDPGATPIAIALAAAEQYYESMGQNWERAAMIKARAAAGDLDAGTGFLKHLQPFVWRRNLDFAAIEDVHSIKRQIHSHRGHGAIAVAGHNIKLGRGGIRDIEFFVQTQQLIAGGRDPDLRQPTTEGAMKALAGAGWIAADTAGEMLDAYRFHRTLEHRLQMIADEQTHSLPQSEEGLEHVARFMGFSRTDRFRDTLLGHLHTVQRHYRALFEKSTPLGEGGNLVFTGTDDDPDTLQTLSALGYAEPATVSRIVRAWHHGRYRAMRSARARELLTQLMPALLKVLARTAEPDAAVARFDRFLQGLPAGVQLFSLLYANPTLLDMLAEVMGSAPRLANYLSQHASILDAVLDPAFYAALPPRQELTASLGITLGRSAVYQDVLDLSRRWLQERKFQLGLQVLANFVDGEAAAQGYSDLAEAVLQVLAPAVEEEFAAQHGRILGGEMVILGMGKLGSRELTETSDLDLIFIYDFPGSESSSDGARPLASTQYYARLGQRLVNALTAMTGEGRLYDVDMRLRPSGHAGPLAVRLETFSRYQEQEAWTWEHMALTRARVVAGPGALARAVTEVIDEVVRRPRDPAATARDVRDMRARVAREKHSRNPWEMKLVRGGLLDLEFLCQYLQLVHAAAYPQVHRPNTGEAFAALAVADVLDGEAASQLLAATRLYRNLLGLLRVAVEGAFDPASAPDGLRQALVRAADMPGFDALEAHLCDTQAAVLERFEALVGSAAGT